ncbi:MAG: ABC transporter ATP-binding protein, partial [Oscillospiraceae bacterium]|nr:ABC transporter ATP-binding protein [Oscillospiraceae bacterium]
MSGQSLRTEALAVGYGKKTVAEDISLLAEPGQILCLIGPNGAGKSTLLKTLLRRLPPLAGAAYLGERALDSLTERELAQNSAAVLTGRPAPELMRSAEVVALGRFPYTGRLGILSREDRQNVRESMEMTGTWELRDEDFTRLSDGQRQRVLLARAICQQPRLLIMDEPTSFLDIRHKLEFLHLLRRFVRQRGLAVVMSMHELDLAQKFSDRLVCMKNGRVDRVGTPGEIFSGDYIQRLFDVTEGSYDSLFGTAEPAGGGGEPRAFV